MRRLRDKVRGYMQHFGNRRGAELRHILFVLPTDGRGDQVAREFGLGRLTCCQFWVTSRQRLESDGPLGHLWLHAPLGHEPRVWRELQLDFGDRRLALGELPATPDDDYAVQASIGKPAWWDWRPGGGEGA